MSIRIGQGYDVHAFSAEPSSAATTIVLGGVNISSHRTLIAHSDGDVLLHALADALLGAVALVGIGHVFPGTSNEWAGADSRDLLRRVMARVAEEGFAVLNVDTTIIAQAPKMAPHVEAMRLNIAEDLGIPASRVSVKATTSERLGFTGRGEGIACQAVCLLEPVTS